jgi:hypothetical protein
VSTEIDLVRDFMNDPEVTTDLSDARSVLDDAIAHEMSLAAVTPSVGTGAPPHTPRHRPLRWGFTLAVAAAVIAAAVFVAVPSTQEPSAPAAAAEIARIADTVPPVPPLAPGQWYQYQLQGALSANVTSGSKASPISAAAVIPIGIGEWSNATGAVCTSEQFGTASFPAAGSAQAWMSMGLVATPANQPATGCSAGVEAGAGTTLGPIDVSNVTHDPATLATDLESGTTGIGQIDNYAHGEPSQVVGFLRLTDLLVGPLKGQWSGFGQEMLQTMALLPGIESLGTMSNHSGEQGLGFSMSTQVVLNPSDGAEIASFTPPTVILDPHNGDLLEARDFDYPVLGSAAQDFVGSPTALVYADGVSYGTTAEWIDPDSGLQVVDQSSVPSWVDTFHIIEAVTAPSSTPSQLASLVNPYLGNGNMDAGDMNVPVEGENTEDITIMGSLSTAQAVATALTSSGLFVSVSLKL